MKDLNEWTKNQIKEIEKMGNTVIGGKLCIRDSSGDNWFIPFSPSFPEPETPKTPYLRQEPPKTEREAVCDDCPSTTAKERYRLDLIQEIIVNNCDEIIELVRDIKQIREKQN